MAHGFLSYYFCYSLLETGLFLSLMASYILLETGIACFDDSWLLTVTLFLGIFTRFKYRCWKLHAYWWVHSYFISLPFHIISVLMFFSPLQMLTLLEGAIRRDYLSSDFETSNELLNNSKTEDMSSQNPSSLPGTSVLPWVPDTTAAITLRMLDLDYAVSYVQNQKKERDGGDSVVR